jgi:hypothetical protein
MRDVDALRRLKVATDVWMMVSHQPAPGQVDLKDRCVSLDFQSCVQIVRGNWVQ